MPTPTAMKPDFDAIIKSLTGHSPLRWQRRLLKQFCAGKLPETIDLPTGLGKTMVMAIWLIARSVNKQMPRRLIYVVDRRTVVDQATDIARKIKKLWKDSPLAVSTLRGQFADNRDWSRDPSLPAIIIGTVDLIGSALLFSGYRSSFKRRPLEAGLLGQDALLVLDEAHLSKSFDKLVTAITLFQANHSNSSAPFPCPPLKVIRMSATSDHSKPTQSNGVFRLDTDKNSSTWDLKPDPHPKTGDERNPIVKRYHAKKRLTTTTADNVVDAMAAAAGDIAQAHPGTRIVVFVRTPKLVDDVRKALVKKDKSRESKIAMLTGTMRGLERDELVDTEKPVAELQHERRVMQRFLKPDNDPSQGECFLLSTSAGEVGFDLNADHMVCDAAPLDSMIQRLGRVNRRGHGKAVVRLILHKDPADKSEIDKACLAAAMLFDDGMDVSPKSLDKFRRSLTTEKLVAATTPEPTTVELTDILLDAWSMTSITERMPGRPEVGPWLRGIAPELPQATIAWRAELELLRNEPDAKHALATVLAKHPIRPHESLTMRSDRVIEFLKAAASSRKGRPELLETRVALKFSRELQLTTIGELIDDPDLLDSDPTLILPATFGGLDRGMLSEDAFSPAAGPDGSQPLSLDVADLPGYETREGAATRQRILLVRDEDRWKPMPLFFGSSEATPITELLGLVGESWPRTAITSALQEKGLRTRAIVKFDLDEEGNPQKLLLLLVGTRKGPKRERQSLTDHVEAVCKEADRIADELELTKDSDFRRALQFAAKWHDAGKHTQVWQRFIGGTVEQPLGKSAKYCDPKKLAGYRHEFGSLLRSQPELPTEDTIRDLASHLIAVHHGHGRPHFGNPFDREFADTSLIDETHIEVIRRFARLQRQYGWWHLAWLENLLRCADAIASAQVNDDENQDDETEVGE